MAGEASIVDRRGLQALIDALRSRGYRVLGPAVHDDVITVREISSVDDLPHGLGDEQDAGTYRLRERGDPALFGYAAPVQSAKPVFFPADELLWRGRRNAQGPGFEVQTKQPGDDRVALFGVRSCDLAAIGVQDAVLAGRSMIDPRYTARRRQTFLVAATCADPASSCFCASMGTGPRPTTGYDLAITELLDDRQRFLLEAGSAAGEEVLADLPGTPVGDADWEAADRVAAEATARMCRHMDTDDLPGILYRSAESPHWDAVARRCLACTNCTMVCPTCFCTSVEDVSDLSGAVDERHRVWDSCFSEEYSRLHAGAVRTSTKARYRQWLTHKLGAWTDQFGMSGCVGCGRCITWCPAAIDITAEVAALCDAATTEPGS